MLEAAEDILPVMTTNGNRGGVVVDLAGHPPPARGTEEEEEERKVKVKVKDKVKTKMNQNTLLASNISYPYRSNACIPWDGLGTVSEKMMNPRPLVIVPTRYDPPLIYTNNNHNSPSTLGQPSTSHAHHGTTGRNILRRVRSFVSRIRSTFRENFREIKKKIKTVAASVSASVSVSARLVFPCVSHPSSDSDSDSSP